MADPVHTNDSASAPDAHQSPATSHPASIEEKAPAANGSAEAMLKNATDTIVSTAQSAMTSVQNNKTVQDIANGPVAQNVKIEAQKTSEEFSTIASSREVPDKPAATGQPLTHYHSMFYRLLSWEQPRATGVAFASTILLILAARYFNVLKHGLKFTYYILGVTASIEIAGKLLFQDGLATKMRPNKYWTIPKESLERCLEDVVQLLNFFVIETQRIVWAENVSATVAAFAAALVSYWLIKLLPVWGLALIGTCVVYLAPLVYIKNQETIDSGLEHMSNVIGEQATQLQKLTAEHTEKATESIKTYTNEYTQKAQELIGSRRSSGPTAVSSAVSSNDFPEAPKDEPTTSESPELKDPPASAPMAI